MPVLSICNLYINMAAQHAIEFTLRDMGRGTEWTSVHGMDTIGNTIDHWLGVGGMLTAATPLIALFLVTGSTYAFTSLTNRMHGLDHLNEKIPTPDAVQPAPLVQMLPRSTNSPIRGDLTTGAERLMPSLNVSEMESREVASAQQYAQKMAQTFSSDLSRGYTDAVSRGHGASFEQGIGEVVNASSGSQVQRVQSAARDFQQKFGLDETTAKKVAGEFSLAASGQDRSRNPDRP